MCAMKHYPRQVSAAKRKHTERFDYFFLWVSFFSPSISLQQTPKFRYCSPAESAGKEFQHQNKSTSLCSPLTFHYPLEQLLLRFLRRWLSETGLYKQHRIQTPGVAELSSVPCSHKESVKHTSQREN